MWPSDCPDVPHCALLITVSPDTVWHRMTCYLGVGYLYGLLFRNELSLDDFTQYGIPLYGLLFGSGLSHSQYDLTQYGIPLSDLMFGSGLSLYDLTQYGIPLYDLLFGSGLSHSQDDLMFGSGLSLYDYTVWHTTV